MKTDTAIIGGVGAALVFFLIWGYRKFAAAPTDLSAPSNIEYINAATVKPAALFQFKASAVEKSPSTGTAPGASCGCLMPW